MENIVQFFDFTALLLNNVASVVVPQFRDLDDFLELRASEADREEIVEHFFMIFAQKNEDVLKEMLEDVHHVHSQIETCPLGSYLQWRLHIVIAEYDRAHRSSNFLKKKEHDLSKKKKF